MSAHLARNRARNPFSGIVSVAPLTTSDLADLKQPNPISDLRKLRAIHHEVAHLLALGHTNREVAAVTGLTENRVCTLAQTPSVVNLIAEKRAMREAAREAAHDEIEREARRGMALGVRLLNEFVDTIDENDGVKDLATARALNKLVTDRMDRFGYGRQSTNVNINANFAAKLEAAITRSAKATTLAPKVIDHDELT